MRGILFATKELDDPLNDSPQRAPCSLRLLDAVVRLLSFNGAIGDRFVAFFSAHALPPFICEPSLISAPDALAYPPAPVALVARDPTSSLLGSVPRCLPARPIYQNGAPSATALARIGQTRRASGRPGVSPGVGVCPEPLQTSPANQPHGRHKFCPGIGRRLFNVRHEFVPIQYEGCWNRGNLSHSSPLH
jgi:hypothetical protein